MFNLTMDIMFIQIRNNDQKNDLKIAHSIIKISAYPEDNYFIARDVRSLQ